MQVHRVDYRLVPGLTHAMAGSLLTRKGSTDTFISPSFIGSGIDPVDQNSLFSSAQKPTLTVHLPFQSETYVHLDDRCDSAPQIQNSVSGLRFNLRNGYCGL